MRTCACHSDDRFECFAFRYGGFHDSGSDECCECACHDTGLDEDEEYEIAKRSISPADRKTEA